MARFALIPKTGAAQSEKAGGNIITCFALIPKTGAAQSVVISH
jgi:hypothetical protein